MLWRCKEQPCCDGTLVCGIMRAGKKYFFPDCDGWVVGNSTYLETFEPTPEIRE